MNEPEEYILSLESNNTSHVFLYRITNEPHLVLTLTVVIRQHEFVSSAVNASYNVLR